MTNNTPQPNANIRRRTLAKLPIITDFFGQGSALITAWSEVLVLPAPLGGLELVCGRIYGFRRRCAALGVRCIWRARTFLADSRVLFIPSNQPRAGGESWVRVRTAPSTKRIRERRQSMPALPPKAPRLSPTGTSAKGQSRTALSDQCNRTCRI
jgi:hypothetical protein